MSAAGCSCHRYQPLHCLPKRVPPVPVGTPHLMLSGSNPDVLPLNCRQPRDDCKSGSNRLPSTTVLRLILEHFSRRCIVWMAILRAHAMARPYSDDLRRKLLEAFDQGKGSLSELAEDFGVSLGWAWKVSAARKRTGRMDRPSYRPGAKRRIDEQVLAGILRSHPDATLVELQAELESKTSLRVSTQHLWRVVKRLGFRLKKSHSTPKSVTRKRTASGAKSSSR
jgi:transposase